MLRPTIPTFRVNAQNHSQRPQLQSRRVQSHQVDQTQCTCGLWFNHRQNIRQHLLSGAHDNQLRRNQRQASPAGPSQQIPFISNDSYQYDDFLKAAEEYDFDSNKTSDSGDELVGDELNILLSSVVVVSSLHEYVCYLLLKKFNTNQKSIMYANGYKKTGEVLLQLDAFDSTKDYPIEILHAMMLDPTKYLAFSTIKYLRAGETDQLQAKLRSYRSRSFGRVLGNCLQVKSTSFVGRDFKIMVQQLPVIFNDLLHNEWSRKTEDRKHKLVLVRNCLVAQDHLVSLLYMGKIYQNFNFYCELIQRKLDDFTAYINIIENVFSKNTTIHSRKQPIISKTPKLHYLHHIKEDLKRFATAIHTESEKGEQFNKLIREHIFYTNRHNPSRDVLELFGRQMMFKHVIGGGAWVDDDSRVSLSSSIQHYLDNHINFREQYLGYDREYTDNNNSSKDMKVGVTGFFMIIILIVYDLLAL
ncbi:hypothetical protein INT45_001411 [Circinella minor]|uniref:Uncharacterized protein n=1 Tax=Circinella minor TaxID=1195481 RepID=A0A8H7V991_9FUNG|nr:hypothetical protein INT45_001411 [Circinella minor]